MKQSNVSEQKMMLTAVIVVVNGDRNRFLFGDFVCSECYEHGAYLFVRFKIVKVDDECGVTILRFDFFHIVRIRNIQQCVRFSRVSAWQGHFQYHHICSIHFALDRLISKCIVKNVLFQNMLLKIL